jgi:hypothetical protein
LRVTPAPLTPDAPPPKDIVAVALERWHACGMAGVEEVIAQHPEAAALIRHRLRLLGISACWPRAGRGIQENCVDRQETKARQERLHGCLSDTVVLLCRAQTVCDFLDPKRRDSRTHAGQSSDHRVSEVRSLVLEALGERQ